MADAPLNPVRVALDGHVGRPDLEAALSSIEAEIAASGAVIVDCLAMTGYDQQARDAFIAWHQAHPTLRVAILTEREAWRMVISAMALASGGAMRAFDTLEEARAWLGLPPLSQVSSA